MHDGERNSQAAPAPIVAPSWSWASVSLRIAFHAGISLSTATVDEDTLSLRSIESFTLCDSPTSLNQDDGLAALHLRGHLMEATCGASFLQEPESIYRRLLQVGEEIKTTFDNSDLSFEQPIDHDYLVLDDIHGVPPGRVHCLPLVIEDRTYTLDIECEVSWGLVLVPVLNKDGYFRRVGIFQTYRTGLFTSDAEDLYLI